jgi:hypothetical protein
MASAATPDAWITTKTKLALLTTEGVSGTAIKVDTVLGRAPREVPRGAHHLAEAPHRIAHELKKAFGGRSSYVWSDDRTPLATWHPRARHG